MRLDVNKATFSTPKSLFIKKVKEDQTAIGIACQIILNDINNQIAFNIIDMEDPRKMWDKLANICSKIG